MGSLSYVIISLATQALTNIVVAFYANKLYPEFLLEGNLSDDIKRNINRRIKDMFTSKVGGVIVDSGDTLVISAFLGLASLAIYQNYFYIINSVTGVIFVVNSSIVAGIGNSLITESKEKNYRDFEKFNFILFWIIGFCVCCFSVLMQPFMAIWVGEDLVLPFGMVILFCIYFLCNVFEKSLSVFKDAGGIWHNDRYRPLIYGIANLILNIISVKSIGLYGILLSTIVTCLIISIPWIIKNIFVLIYERKVFPFVLEITEYIFVIVIAGIINYFICSFIYCSIYISFVLKCIVCVIVPNIVFLVVYRRNPLFKECIILAKKVIKI